MYYIAELLESNLAQKSACACGVCARTSHCSAATPSYGWQADSNVTPLLPPTLIWLWRVTLSHLCTHAGCAWQLQDTELSPSSLRSDSSSSSSSPRACCWVSRWPLMRHTACRAMRAVCGCLCRLQRPLLFLGDKLLRFPLDWKKSSSPISVVSIKEHTVQTTVKEGAVFPCAHLFRCWLTLVKIPTTVSLTLINT